MRFSLASAALITRIVSRAGRGPWSQTGDKHGAAHVHVGCTVGICGRTQGLQAWARVQLRRDWLRMGPRSYRRRHRCHHRRTATGRSPPPVVLAWRHKVSVSSPSPPRCRRTWRCRHHVPLVSLLPIADPSLSRQRPSEHMTHMQLWAVLLYVHRTVCYDHCIVRVWPVCMFSVLAGPLSVLFVAFLYIVVRATLSLLVSL